MNNKLLTMGRRQLDDKLKPWHVLRQQGEPGAGWIRTIRTSLGLTKARLAARCGLSSEASIAGLERSEMNGTISLNSLRKVAEAMDCSVVYAIVPRTTLESILEVRAQEKANAMLRQVEHTMELEVQGVEPSASKRQIKEIVETLLENPKSVWK